MVLIGLVVVVGVVALHLGRILAVRPQRGLLLVVALAPFDGLLLIVPHPPALVGWKEAVLALSLLASFTTTRSPRRRPRRRLPTWVVPAVLYVAAGVFSALLSHDLAALVGLKINYVYLMAPLLLWRCPLDHRERDQLVTILMTTGTITAVIGLAQQAVGADALNRFGYEWNSTIRFAGDQLRSFSTFEQPFPFALFVMFVVLIGLSVALDDPRRTRNRYFLLASPILVAGMATAVVRASILGLAIGLVYLMARRYRSLLHIAAPVIAIVLLLPTGLRDALFSGTSLDQRTTGWTALVEAGGLEPLGGGIGTAGRAGELAADDGTAYQPDNYYMKLLVELGPIGVWIFVVFVLVALAYTGRIARRARGPDAGLATGIGASLVAALVAATVATYWEIFPLDLLFWTSLGVITSIDIDLRSTPSRSHPGAAVSRRTSGNSFERSDR